MTAAQLTSDEKKYGIRNYFAETKRFKPHVEVWHLYHAYRTKFEAVEEAKELRKIQYAVYRARVVAGPCGCYAVYSIKE